MFGFGKKEPERSLESFVKKNHGSDEFLLHNRNEGKNFLNVLFIALTVGMNKGQKIKSEKETKKKFKGTNIDIIACEFTLFAIKQAEQILVGREVESDDFDDDDLYDEDEDDILSNVSKAGDLLEALGESFYSEFEGWFSDRKKNYGNDPKTASECLAFNLTAIAGEEDFVGLGQAVKLDLKVQLQMMAHAMAFRKVMVPAFIESVERMEEVLSPSIKETKPPVKQNEPEFSSYDSDKISTCFGEFDAESEVGKFARRVENFIPFDYRLGPSKKLTADDICRRIESDTRVKEKCLEYFETCLTYKQSAWRAALNIIGDVFANHNAKRNIVDSLDISINSIPRYTPYHENEAKRRAVYASAVEEFIEGSGHGRQVARLLEADWFFEDFSLMAIEAGYHSDFPANGTGIEIIDAVEGYETGGPSSRHKVRSIIPAIYLKAEEFRDKTISPYTHRRSRDEGCAICDASGRVAFHVFHAAQDPEKPTPKGFVPMSQSFGTLRGSLPVCEDCCPPCIKCGLPMVSVEMEAKLEKMKDSYDGVLKFGNGICGHEYEEPIKPISSLTQNDGTIARFKIKPTTEKGKLPKMKNPVQCVFWKQPELFKNLLGDDRFEILDRFIDGSHLSRFLVKCHECGQLYVYEDYEVSWMTDATEPSYNILLPVDSEEEAKNLKNTRSEWDLLDYFPRLQYDSIKKTPKWSLAEPE